MNFIKKHKFSITVVVLVFIVLLVIYFSFFAFTGSLNIYSELISFFGNFFSAVLGAIATILAVHLDINHNQKQHKEDERLNVRPYLCVKNCHGYYIRDDSPTAMISIQNVGNHAACDLSLYDGNLELSEKNIIYNEHNILSTDPQNRVDFILDFNRSEYYVLQYFDICGNIYNQELRFVLVKSKEYDHVRMIEYGYTLEPKLFKSRKERKI